MVVQRITKLRLLLLNGMIPLILLASVPEVFCCCNISWGPGGISGSPALCLTSGSCQSSDPHCDCCCQTTHEATGSSVGTIVSQATVDQCSQQTCRCSFSLVSPDPIWRQSADELDLPVLAIDWTELLHFNCAAKQPPVSRDWSEPDGFVLTPQLRCALFQTWQA